MVKVKSLTQSQSNYTGSASIIPDRYRAGVQDADWKTNAESDQAEQLYATKVQEAIQQKSRQAGIRNVSNDEWKTRAIEKGASAIGNAVRNSGDKWAKKFRPFHEALGSLNLPPRSADPMTNVDNRLKAVVQTMVDTKRRNAV